jgi:hypothetical protein
MLDLISGIVGPLDRLFVHIPGLRRDALRKKLLLEALENPKYQWISVDTLARAAALVGNLDRVRDLLVSIHARPSRSSTGPEVWGLISRVGE